jgi:hypothetical protein
MPDKPEVPKVECPEKPWKKGKAAKVHGIPFKEKQVKVRFVRDAPGFGMTGEEKVIGYRLYTRLRRVAKLVR